MAVASGPPALPKLAHIVKGNIAFSMGLMMLLMLGTIFYMPIVLPLVVEGVQINSWDIAKPLLLMMVSPLIIGLFIKAKLSAIAPIIQPILFKLSNAGLLLGLVVRLIVHTSPVKVTNSRIIMPCDRSLGKTFWFTVNKPSSKRKKTTSAASSDDTPPDDQDFEENPATATINITAVEIPELTEEEQRDRLHLERRVERAVFEAGKALMELRI